MHNFCDFWFQVIHKNLHRLCIFLQNHTNKFRMQCNLKRSKSVLMNVLKCCSTNYSLPPQIASNYSKFKSIGCICFITKSVQTHHSRLCSVCTKGVWGNSKCTCFLPCNLHLFRLQSQSVQLHPSSLIVSDISLFLLTQVTVCIYVTWSLHL